MKLNAYMGWNLWKVPAFQYTLMIVMAVMLAVLLLTGCTQQHHQSLTPEQISATQPVSSPLTSVNTVIHHAQIALEPINILAFVVALVGVGVVIYGVITVDHPLEHIGMIVAAVAGAVTLGTLAGLIALPFAPWIFAFAFIAGVGYVVYVLYEKHLIKKPVAVTVVATPPSEPKA